MAQVYFSFYKHLCLFFCSPFLSLRKDPFIVARVSPASSVHLSRHAKLVTHTFILEAVGGEQFCACVCFVRLKEPPLNVSIRPSFLKVLAFDGGCESIGTSVEKVILKHGICTVVDQYI